MKRCNYCFTEYEDEFDVCPACGYVKGDGAKELYHLYPGTTLHDRYIIGQVLGHGGFGITYMAWDKRHNIIMAIKEYYPSGLVNRVPGTQNVLLFTGNRLKEYNHGLMRFLDEARNMAKFSSHENIINVFEYFEENNTAYIVMEYLDGTTLNDFLKHNRMDYESGVEVVGHICHALKDIHEAGIVHRDVSPDNIFLCTNGVIKLIDFGAARFSSGEEQQRTIILKPGFAPPEQYEQVNIQGPWTDIYALGATLYYMVTGMKPEESTNRKISDTLLPPHEVDESIPEYIGNSIMQAMAIEKHMRFTTVSDFEKALNQKKKVLPVKTQIKRRKYRRLIGISAAALAVIVSISLFYMNWDRQRAEETLPDASISIAFFLTGNEAFDSAREAAFSDIIETFQASFPNVTIDMRSYPIAGYEFAIFEAMTAGDSPTLFESTGFSAGMLENALDLSGVVNQLEHDEFHFLSEYSLHFSDAKQLPLGFRAPVVYLNTSLVAFEGVSLRNMEDLLAADFDAEVPIVVGDADRGAFQSAFGRIRAETSEYTRGFFFAGRAGAYFSNTSTFFAVQEALPARYRLLYIDTDSPLAQFTDLWSISRYIGGDERRVAERFLTFMLSDHAQDVLHIRNRGGNLPINRYVLGVFSQVYNDFDGFFANIDSYTFPSAATPLLELEILVGPIELPPPPPLPPLPFGDVEEHWAEDAIRFVFEEGIMGGTTETIFAPDGTVSRAMAAMMLYRIAGEPAAAFEAAFEDVPDYEWFAAAVSWAHSHTLIPDVDSAYTSYFRPNEEITREAFVAKLYLYARHLGLAVILEAEDLTLEDFPDAHLVSAWAEAAMLWAIDRGLVEATSAGMLNPLGLVTRAECAVMLQQLFEGE